MQARIVDLRERRSPADPKLVAARLRLTITASKLGDYREGVRLGEVVLASLEESVPDEHPHRLAARQIRALAAWQLGDLASARGEFEKLLETRRRLLPDELARLRRELARLGAELGDTVLGLDDDGERRRKVEELTLARDRALTAVHARLEETGALSAAVDPASIARALPDCAVAVGYVRYDDWRLDAASA